MDDATIAGQSYDVAMIATAHDCHDRVYKCFGGVESKANTKELGAWTQLYVSAT